MEAAAILAATAVNSGNKPTANAPQAAEEFKILLNQQVKGQIQAAPPAQAMVLPEVKGLKEMLELLQQFIASAGDQKEAETAGATELNETVVPVEAETSDNATGVTEILFSGVTETVGTMPIPNTAAGPQTALDAAETKETVTVSGPGQAVTSGIAAAARMTAAGTDSALGKGAARMTTAVGSTAGDAGKVKTGSNPLADAARTFAAPVLMEGLDEIQRRDTTQSGSETASRLSQKLSELAAKFTAGREVTTEIRELMKEFGPAPVIKEMKNMPAGLMNSGNDAAELLKDPLTQPEKGGILNYNLEKAAVKPGITAEAPKEPTVSQVQFNRTAEVPVSSPQSIGQGAVEPANITISTQDSGAVNRFVPLQHNDAAKTPVNSFIRWTEDILGQIGEKARLILGSGQSEMQIQLKPDFLGKVNLQVTLENGQVTARIGVENLQVKELVEANLKQLQQNLDSQGIKVSSLVVDLSANRQFQHFNRPHDYGHGHTVRLKSTGNGEGYGSLPTDDRIVPAGWRSLDSTVDYIA